MSAIVEAAPPPSEPHHRAMAPVARPGDDASASQRTPTRSSFLRHDNDVEMAGTLNQASAVVTAPDEDGRKRSYIDRVNSQRSTQSQGSSSNRGTDDGVDAEHDQDDSDNESERASASGRPSKKKKGQRFYCTDYPPCNLSFTRSEHLARHIRKHTGERPFQCHCLRKFSRLDNLRQHAQTVHVNEDIPTDSLAATGTRFQRQIRTDRMRNSGHRPRASTVSNASTASRGHSRNISGSSISSMPSDVGSPDDRRGPPALAMAPTTPRRQHLTVDTVSMNASPQPYYTQYYTSPTGYSTPTSVFSGETGSPREPHARLHSPISMAPRAMTWGSRPRRLSVPNAPNPFQPIGSLNSSHSAFINSIPPPQSSAFSQHSSVLSSPTNTAFSSEAHQQQQQHGPISEAEWKRRTWHPPGSYHRPATSGLSYYQTPDAPQPVSTAQPAATQAVRLPGIDSFDRFARRPPSPMEVDGHSRRGSVTESIVKAESESRHHRDSWGSMDHHLTKLDLSRAPQSESRPVTASGPPLPSAVQAQQQQQAYAPAHQLSGEPGPEVIEEPATPSRRGRRDAWYVGPASSSTGDRGTHRTSPEGSASSEGLPTPSSTTVADVNPAIRHINGYMEGTPAGVPVVEHHKPPRQHAAGPPQPAPHQGYSYQYGPAPTSGPGYTGHSATPRSSEDMNRLDALVAVATSESETAAAAAARAPAQR